MKNHIKLLTLAVLFTATGAASAADVRSEIVRCDTELAGANLSGGPTILSTSIYPGNVAFCREEMAKIKSQNKKQVITGYSSVKNQVRTKIEESSLPVAAASRTLHLCTYQADDSRASVRVSSNVFAEAKDLCSDFCKRYALVLDGKEMKCRFNIINETSEGGRSISSAIDLPL